MTEPDGFSALDPVIQHHVVNTLGWPALRPLQEHAIGPVLRGEDALLLAPTAGGKTEAALFPLFTRMSRERWRGTSVLYLCPLKALLNNIHLRAAQYGAWLGRTAALRHGDIGAAARRRQVLDPPDILLTTPESLESLLVSAVYDPAESLRDVRAVVVDEVHAFAGDDRGWHLLAVLERVSRITGRPVQRIGCSATVGNAPDLLAWLQGTNRTAGIPASVVNPPAPLAAVHPAVGLDYVGNTANAATVIASLHQGEKRLVFADSRRGVETLAGELRDRDVTTFVSHSSLALDERRRAETAFAEARDCVIVSTSTLELGIDVGDLDRVLQIGAPATVASFLQRLGRTGRRPGSTRNALFLETSTRDLLRAAGLLLLWGEGYVEPILAPAAPLHVVAQQVLAGALGQARVTLADVRAPLEALGMATPAEIDAIVTHLFDEGFLGEDGGILHLGPAAESHYGRKHFLELLAVFSSAPELLVLHGAEEIGAIDPLALRRGPEGPKVIALAGRSWVITSVDWRRMRAHVEPTDKKGRSTWMGAGTADSPELCRAMRRIAQGEDPAGVTLSARALKRLATLREEWGPRAVAADPVLVEDAWWTWAGARHNQRWLAALDAVEPGLTAGTCDNLRIPLAATTSPWELARVQREALSRFGSDLERVVLPLDERELERLKFSDLLPRELARRTLASR